MTAPYVNLDAEWLRGFAETMRQCQKPDGWNLVAEGDLGRLLRIAQNIQALDEQSSLEYQRGLRDGEARALSRSNVLPPANPEGEDAVGTATLAQIERHNVTKVPFGKRALSDQPGKFNAPPRRHRTTSREVTLSLDLSILETL